MPHVAAACRPDALEGKPIRRRRVSDGVRPPERPPSAWPAAAYALSARDTPARRSASARRIGRQSGQTAQLKRYAAAARATVRAGVRERAKRTLPPLPHPPSKPATCFQTACRRLENHLRCTAIIAAACGCSRRAGAVRPLVRQTLL